MESETFEINDGLKQGGVMSPLLFIVVMDDVIKATKKEIRTVNIGYHMMKKVCISVCAFADDLVMCAANEANLRENLNIWEKELTARNMKINAKKTKVMMVGKENRNMNIELNNEKIEQVNTYKYLGVTIDREGNMKEEIDERISNAARLYHNLSHTFIGKKEISRKTKMTVYKTVFRPILIYGSESWILTNTMKSRIQAIDMKYLRRTKGVTRRDRIRNDIIREELEIEPITNVIEKQQLKWYGHLIRMQNERPVKSIWEARIQRSKKRGRPRKTWNDEVATILKKKEITWTAATRMAKNKKEWTHFVHATEL